MTRKNTKLRRKRRNPRKTRRTRRLKGGGKFEQGKEYRLTNTFVPYLNGSTPTALDHGRLAILDYDGNIFVYKGEKGEKSSPIKEFIFEDPDDKRVIILYEDDQREGVYENSGIIVEVVEA